MTTQRYNLTESEHLMLVELGDKLSHQLAMSTADLVAAMPRDLQTLTLEYLQERCNVYATRYEKYLDIQRKVHGT